MRNAALLAGDIAAGLRAGQAYSAAYARAKRTQGLVDFDDLIRATVRLLDTPGMGDWVRYKLDQITDHILVDEAQDTNAKQWNIIFRLTEEFFSGFGARGRSLRTLFTVGDFKQAIFGFQGTDPYAFEAARIAFERIASESSQELPLSEQRLFSNIALDTSFRSAPAVLRLVDRLVEDIGTETMGLVGAAEPHIAFRKISGRVTLR